MELTHRFWLRILYHYAVFLLVVGCGQPFVLPDNHVGDVDPTCKLPHAERGQMGQILGQSRDSCDSWRLQNPLEGPLHIRGCCVCDIVGEFAEVLVAAGFVGHDKR